MAKLEVLKPEADDRVTRSDVNMLSDTVIVRTTIEELEQRNSSEVCRLFVENGEGLTALFWVHVAVKNGRPQVTIATKPRLDAARIVNKTLTGTCNRR
jgi:hypothetical protein